MDYVEPAAAREIDGLRLALTAHAPAPYSLSARAILDHHGVPYAILAVSLSANNHCQSAAKLHSFKSLHESRIAHELRGSLRGCRPPSFEPAPRSLGRPHRNSQRTAWTFRCTPSRCCRQSMISNRLRAWGFPVELSMRIRLFGDLSRRESSEFARI